MNTNTETISETVKVQESRAEYIFRVTTEVIGSIFILCVSLIAGWIYYSVEHDDEYPGYIISDSAGFMDIHGNLVKEVRVGDIVYYSKKFCVSLEDPVAMAREVKELKRPIWAGDNMLLEDQRNYFGLINGVVRASFVNGVVVPLPERKFKMAEGCYDVTQAVRIPKALTPGENRMRFEFIYYRNQFQYITGKGVGRNNENIRFVVLED